MSVNYCSKCGQPLERNQELEEAANALLELTIERVPVQFSPDNEMYEEDDEQAPFFSEAYLYNLLGKDDARSVLRVVREVLEAAGVKNARRRL